MQAELQLAQNNRLISQAELSRTLLKAHELENEASRLRQEAAELKHQVTEKEALLSGILHSSSWKVTAPMRTISEFLRRGK
jgi:hypothetical protein